ncbi:DUF2812 domain-containing protein [Paenibacillaceae bacterium WGS1546]|uniref:DUF2812 domain-containing protein n=1 Tax=Cohnella sp. WGS1546 TaxID=3366810 RepID=UPI00372D4971
MKRFKLFRSYHAEEKWLSEQARAGWRLVKKGVFYTFRKQSPQQLVFNVDYRTFKRRADYESYLSLFSDAGWTHAAGNIRSGEQYFTAPVQQGKELSIFSDKESSHSRYKKKSSQYLLKALITLAFIGVGGIFNLFDYQMIIQPGRAFQTPGIWEKTGEAFWQAFLFELPFALIFRIVPCILLLGYTLLVIFFAAWAMYCTKLDRGLDHEQLE